MLEENIQTYYHTPVFDRRRRSSNLSNLEKNCNQIFVKAPAITREFFEKINNDVVPPKTVFFGHQINTKNLIVITGLILLFAFSTIGTITMWFTKAFHKQVENMMVLSEDSLGYQMWKHPTINPTVKIHFFNYTNVDDFEKGHAKKLHVQEVGPHVYFEELERVNVRFNKVDGTVSYQEKRNYIFNPNLSNGNPNDTVVVPNVVLLTSAALVKKLSFLARISLNGIFQVFAKKPFIAQEVDKYLLGYHDQLYDLAKTYLIFNDKPVFENFGLFALKQGIQPDIYTMNTGAHNIEKLGQIERINDKTHYDIWRSESCNKIQASTGLIFPMASIKAKKPIDFLFPQICRKLPVHFSEETRMLEKIPVYRYRIPENVFDSISNDDNKCYCEKSTNNCPQKGVFDATSCSFGAPIFFSWPYFQRGDSQLTESITGLKKKHFFNTSDNYLDINPIYGNLLRGKLSFQINIQVRKSYGLSELDKYEDKMILPIMWFEFGADEKDFPSDIINLIYHITITIRNLELGLKYGFLLCTIMTAVCILLLLRKINNKNWTFENNNLELSI